MSDSATLAPKRLAASPVADTETVETLVRKVVDGTVRIPSFQRGLKWKAKDVRDLFDSIYVGYPVGSLLLWKAPAVAERLAIGPLDIAAPETQAALWVVDGQQRLVSLAAGLARPTPVPRTPDDPYVLYFDPIGCVFKSPDAAGNIPDTWVPVAELLDATRLSEWVFNWAHAQRTDLRKAVFDAGTRIRQYGIPRYTVETDDVEMLKEIFFRVNSKGKALEWKDVHDALFGAEGTSPSTLESLAERLMDVGMGNVSRDLLLSCVIASKGLDPTQDVAAHYERDPDLLRGAVLDALPALRATLAFLQRDAEIPHIRLLPVSLPVPVLTRFFVLFPDPSARVRTLLARWTWRVMLEQTDLNRRTLLRRGVAVLDGKDAETAVQSLLEQTHRDNYRSSFQWPDRFDARSANTRFAMLGMASLTPLDLESGHPVDVATLFETDEGTIPRVWGPSSAGGEEAKLRSSPGNRILLPETGLARAALSARAILKGNKNYDDTVLASHGIESYTAEVLLNGDIELFILYRSDKLYRTTFELAERMAGHDLSDRPSIEHLLEDQE